jgi:hypothetical protein
MPISAETGCRRARSGGETANLRGTGDACITGIGTVRAVPVGPVQPEAPIVAVTAVMTSATHAV